MTKVWAFDVEAQEIERIAEENGVGTSDVVQAMMDAINDNDINIVDYL